MLPTLQQRHKAVTISNTIPHHDFSFAVDGGSAILHQESSDQSI